MIKLKIQNEILYIEGTGPFTFEEFDQEMKSIMSSGEKYLGFITSGELLKGTSALVLKKCSEHHKTNHPTLPNAALFKNLSLVALGNIYLKFTNAINTRLFSNEQEAITWINQKKLYQI